MKPLLVVYQFREIPPFLESVKDLKIDKLWIKFHPQREAYNIGRAHFLVRKEYTHFLLLTDDVIVKQSDIDQLCEDAEKNPDKEVISAWFNGNLTDHANDTNFSFILPPDPPSSGTYEGYQFESISSPWSFDRESDLIEVKHQGTALTLLTRNIVQEIPFRDSGGCCIDSCLALDLHAKGIKQYVDLRLRTLHLKINDEMQARISKVGINTPSVEFVPKDAK